MSDLFVDTQRKFQLVRNPVAPGSCRGCFGDKMTSGVEYFVDLGYSDEQGAVYLCNRCLKEIANLFGFYQRTNRMDQRVLDLERQVQIYELQLDRLRSVGIDVDQLCFNLASPSNEGESVSEGKGTVERERVPSFKSDSSRKSGSTGSTGRFALPTGDSSE